MSNSVEDLIQSIEALSSAQLKKLYMGLDLAKQEKAIALARKELQKKEAQKIKSQIAQLEAKLKKLDK